MSPAVAAQVAPAPVRTVITVRPYPDAHQLRKIRRFDHVARWLWNTWIDDVGAGHAGELMVALPVLMRQEPYRELPFDAARLLLRKLQLELQAGQVPVRRRRRDLGDVFQMLGRDVSMVPGLIRVPTLGWVAAPSLRLTMPMRTRLLTFRRVCGGFDLMLDVECMR